MKPRTSGFALFALGVSWTAAASTQPDPRLLASARQSRDCALQKGVIHRRGSLLAVIDFSLPSSQKRLWVLDEATGEVLFHEWVTHGRATGDLYATAFSDDEGSHQSSLGLYVAAETYSGKHGYSLRLDGLEIGLNANARERAIVIHGADYATPSFLASNGRLGRSHGCPAVRPSVAESLIDTLRGGTPVFAWSKNGDWDRQTQLSQCHEAKAKP